MKNIFVLYSFNNAFFTPTKLNVDRKKKVLVSLNHLAALPQQLTTMK